MWECAGECGRVLQSAGEWRRVREDVGVCGSLLECGSVGELGSARVCAGVRGSVREFARVLKVHKVVQEGAGFYY